MRPYSTTSSLRLWLSGLALSMVLAMQWLALVHSVGAHGRSHALSAATLVLSESVAQGVQSVASSHDEGSVFCKLLDQCLQAGHVAAGAVAPVHVVSGAITFPAVVAAAPDARWASYLARAPPALVLMHQA